METKLHKSIDRSKAVKSIKDPVRYMPDAFGFDIPNHNPTDISIVVLDTGLPSHSDLNHISKCSKSSCIDLLVNKCDISDANGHATAISGVLCGSNPGGVIGMCPSAKYMFCKVMDDEGNGNTNNLTAGLLWSLGQDFDIALLSNGSAIDDRYLNKIIKKCYDMKKILVVASGREVTKTSKSLYPAAYEGVISCSSSRSNRARFFNEKNRLEIDINMTSMWSTFLDDSYIKVGGSSIAAAITCGAVANFLYQLKINNKQWESVSDFMKLFYEKIRK